MKQWAALAVAILVVIVAAFSLGLRLGREKTTTAASPQPPEASGSPVGVEARGVQGDSTEAQLSINGRSIETDASIRGLSSVRLAGRLNVSIPGRSSSDAKDTGTVTASGDDVTIEARSLSLNASTLIRPDDVRLSLRFGHMSVSVAGPTTVRAADITVNFGNTTATRRGSFTFVADTASTTFGGEIRATKPPRWVDAPKSFTVSDSARSWTSWAGPARVRVGKRSFSDEFGAFAGKGLRGTITRSPGRVRATARAVAQQVYLDGVPQFETKATCDLIEVREQTEPGRRIELTWAPRNLGDFDMLMTRLVPVGRQASWLSFGLERGPSTFGGETRKPVGGQTTGFLPGGAIRSVLPPGDADRRDIGVVVPEGTPTGTYDATVRIEGNFKPFTVAFEVTVVPAPAATTRSG